MNEQLSTAIETVKANKYSFCKFVSPNDAGDTGGHQAGLYIPKNSIKLLFDKPGIKGENKEKLARLTWQDGQTVECRFIYYGKGSRNEYRITRLGKHFHEGDFVIIVKKNEEEYFGFYLTEQNKIKNFLQEFNIEKEDTNSLIPLPTEDLFSLSVMPDQSAEFNFKPRARIIKVIGQELISNDVIALVELIKNSYDADALSVEIELNDIFTSNGEIIIKDDGLGMSHEKIVNVWLEPATPDKKNKLKDKFSKCFERRLLGEKGIGRFAAHRLGNYIELTTRAREECNSNPLEYEINVKIDWETFSEDKYLDEVPIKVTKIPSPRVFPIESGTLIKITGIQQWKNFKTVKDAVLKIRGLETPIQPKKIKRYKEDFVQDPGIKISITSNDIDLNREINELKSLKDLLETAFYKFTAVISETGEILYEYSFDRPDYQDIKRTSDKHENLANSALEWFEEHTLTSNNSPGEFEVSFYAWDLDTAALRVAGLADYYRNIIKPNAGVRIYRDNFRVWPYGEEDNDWLNLDLTRLNAPSDRSVSRNQIFGVVHISSTENSPLKDQSNREGLIVNEQYEQFYNLVKASLAVFAKERKVDKSKMDKVSVRKNSKDIVSQSIDLLKNKIKINNHESLYKDSVDKIEEAYHGRIDDLLERYMMAAAIGISYSVPIHEMKLRLTSIRHVIEDIERNAVVEDRYLRELAKQLNDTEDIIRAVSSIMSRQKKQKVSLEKVANNVIILKQTDLLKYDINIEVIGQKKIEVEAVPGLLNTAALNLVDNAIYWLRAKKLESRIQEYNFTPKITIEIGEDELFYFFTVKDNGNGFEDSFDLLIEPYYSRKSDGLGLGLYLTNEIMIRFGGKLSGYNENGAVFQLLFKK